jgi:cytochrome c
MQLPAFVALCATALAPSACGSKIEPPDEQIIVRKPGEPAGPSANSAAGSQSATLDVVAAGKAAFITCSTCHSVERGGASGVGPNLHGVVGRRAGSLAGFAYSQPMATSGITWGEAELNSFLSNPAGKVPGTSMTTGAVTDAGRRAAIVAYLSSLAG